MAAVGGYGVNLKDARHGGPHLSSSTGSQRAIGTLRSSLASLGRKALSLRLTGSQGPCVSREGSGPAGLSWVPTPISSLQLPQLAVPEGCRGRPGAQVRKHLVLVRMLSCRCQAQTSKTVPLSKKTLNLSGAAYDLAVLAETRFGRSTIQRWHLPTQELTGARGTGDGSTTEAGSALR